MDQPLAGLLSFPPHPPPAKPLTDGEYDAQIQTLLKQLNATSASSLLKPINGTDSILTILDPSLNSLPYLYALLARIQTAKGQTGVAPDTTLWSGIESFVRKFDPIQIRYAGTQYKQLIDELLSIALQSADVATVRQTLGLVEQAMLRLDPSTSTFTSTHLDLVKVCLQRKVYDGCTRILDNEIHHFPPDTDGSKHIPPPCAKHITSSVFMTSSSGFSAKLSYRVHLQYFLLGAMCHISQRSWARALGLLELALMSPVANNTVSMIQVEAYKKWNLVSILSNGKAGVLPRGISPHVYKYLNALAKPYVVLSEAFKEDSSLKLRAEYKVAADNSVWQRDNNLVLAKLVVAAHRRAQVLNFSKIYASIPLNTLSELMSDNVASPQPENPAAVEADLRHLIDSHSIHAVISRGKDGSEVVKFLTATAEPIVPEQQKALALQKSVARVAALGVHVKDAQSRLELTKEYIEATKKRRKPAKEGADGLSGVGDVQSYVGVDEDMVADY